VLADLIQYGRVITNKELGGRTTETIDTDPDYAAEIRKNERVLEIIASCTR